MFIMLIRPIACVVNYVTTLNESLKKISSKKLTKSQRVWFTIVLMGIIVTGSFNWAAFERRSLGEHKESGLRWVFRHAKIMWARLLQASIVNILSHYEINKGVLVLDDSDKMRSRNTSKIAGVHKVKDKKTVGILKDKNLFFFCWSQIKLRSLLVLNFIFPIPQ